MIDVAFLPIWPRNNSPLLTFTEKALSCPILQYNLPFILNVYKNTVNRFISAPFIFRTFDPSMKIKLCVENVINTRILTGPVKMELKG